MQKAVLSFELGPAKNEAVLAALKPEISREMPRSTARVWLEKGLLFLEVKAEDSVSLRASVNSYLRWVKVAADAADAGTKAVGRTNSKNSASKSKAPKKGARIKRRK
jgi:tRNA threonylcarbamoyladenosine modification (KEOPS) complex  Pcc1 subunit